MKALDVTDEFRRRVGDTVRPYLWSDDEVLVYFNHSYREFIRLIGGIRDSQGELASLLLSSGTEFVELDQRILRIVSARVVDGCTLDLVGPRHDLALAKPLAGRLIALVQGEDDTGLRPVRIPDEDYELALVVERLPLAPAVFETTLEMRDEHAFYLVPGMQAQAYTKVDAETEDEKSAADRRAEFLAHCADAFKEKRRRSGSARTVQYGGY